MTPLRLNVSDLLRRPGTSRHVRLEAPVTGLGSPSATADEEVGLDVFLDSVLGGVVVRGSLVGSWRAECSRCLGSIERALQVDVDEVFGTGGREESDEADTYPLEGEELDLEPMVRDLVLLELPVTPLCDPGCRGLCPQCGADLNSQPCRCADVVPDPRWGALSELRLEPEGA